MHRHRLTYDNNNVETVLDDMFLSSGIAFLHFVKVVYFVPFIHRDLKTENNLIDDDSLPNFKISNLLARPLYILRLE